MKKIYFLFIFSVQLAYSQKNPYDSLGLKLASIKVDAQKLEIIKQLVDIAFESDIEKALEFSRRGVQLADKIRDKNLQPEFYEMEGRMLTNLLHLDSATLFFNKAMAGYKAIDNKRGQAITAFKISWIYKKKGEPDKALASDLTASALMEKLDDKKGMAAAYERVSEVTRQGRLNEAQVHFAKICYGSCNWDEFWS